MSVVDKATCNILVVDDDPAVLNVTKLYLEKGGYENLSMIQDPRLVIPLLNQKDISLIILDLIMPHIRGTKLLPTLQQEFSHIPIIVMTASEDLTDAISCWNASEYLIKPVALDRLLTTVEKVLRIRGLQKELTCLEGSQFTENPQISHIFSKIVTCSKKMRAIFQYAEYISKSSQPVLITGESGVGKELLAVAIHELGRKGEFITVNVAGLDDQMFADTLYGHCKGAFTGADKDRKGLIWTARGGTLFLDEIGDLSYPSQTKLLRFLQEHNYYPLGSDKLIESDAHIITSTHKDLLFMAETGNFRKDLYYRLCTHHINIPPLCERLEDIPLLLIHFIKKAAAALGKQEPVPSKELLALLPKLSFPGNVREFQSIVTDAVARHQSGLLTIQHFQAFNTARAKNNEVITAASKKSDHFTALFGDKFPTMEEIHEFMISKAMEISEGNKTEAAALLGITRQTINSRERLKKSCN